jgi:hypothetical protein
VIETNFFAKFKDEYIRIPWVNNLFRDGSDGSYTILFNSIKGETFAHKF